MCENHTKSLILSTRLRALKKGVFERTPLRTNERLEINVARYARKNETFFG